MIGSNVAFESFVDEMKPPTKLLHVLFLSSFSFPLSYLVLPCPALWFRSGIWLRAVWPSSLVSVLASRSVTCHVMSVTCHVMSVTCHVVSVPVSDGPGQRGEGGRRQPGVILVWEFSGRATVGSVSVRTGEWTGKRATVPKGDRTGERWAIYQCSWNSSMLFEGAIAGQICKIYTDLI